jgi:hypothetical protein
VHHEQLQLGHVVHHKLLELVGKVVPRLLVSAVSDVGHQGASLELPPHTGVNTLGPAPAGLGSSNCVLVRARILYKIPTQIKEWT